jgi:hypothetical protein
MCFCCVLSGGQEGGGAKRLRSSSCAKHYFAYSLENCYTLGDNCRMNFNAVTDQRDIEDTYASLLGHQDTQQAPALCPRPPPVCHRPFSCVVLWRVHAAPLRCAACCWLQVPGGVSGSRRAWRSLWSNVLLQRRTSPESINLLRLSQHNYLTLAEH